MSEKQHAKTVYVREDAIVPGLDTWIGGLFDNDHLDATAQALAAASEATPEDDRTRVPDLRRQLKECDNKLAKYRALLEHDNDIAIVAVWIAEVERERRNLERELDRKPTPTQTQRERSQSARRPTPRHRGGAGRRRPSRQADIYEELGVKLTYYPEGRVHVAAGAPQVLGARAISVLNGVEGSNDD